ncbi:hypothetical protein SRABI98_03542 [Microbacterium sp. Bi98]|uniref:hypothetical protein n=1 Tax=Microbacterium sp. Bi98 TaxID=2821116 RepID=UPI001E0FFC76|nr:hypothetical protein [Microbacterium sp. Bi98]CAH0262423.1 hypothetical protein SRABI98_03542 [Microbacterium sp. Bi98]
MDEAAWIAHRDTALTPDGVTGLRTTERDRREFLTGMQIMGLLVDRAGEVQDPKPQQLLVVDMLAVGHTINAVIMPRRSTKTATILAVVIGRCACRPRQNSAFTLATTGLKAREKFGKEVLDVIEAAYPEKRDRPVKVSRQAGAESITFPNRSVFSVHAPIGDNFRASAYDAVFIDESGRAKPDMTEDLLAAIPPTFDTTGGQFIVAGTADKIRTGNLLYEVLFAKAAELGAGILRYNAPDSTTEEQLADWEPTEANPFANVRELVERHHPGIGNLTTLEAVERNFRLQPRAKFIFEYLGIFGDEGTATTLVSPALWEKTTIEGATPDNPGKFSLAIAIHPDGLWASVGVAWQCDLEPADLVAHALHDAGAPLEQRTAIGLLHHQQGVKGFWQRVLLLARKHRVPIIYDSASQSAAVEIEQLMRATPRPAFEPAKTADVRQGATKLLKLLEANELAHWPSERLDRAASIATKRAIGTYGGFGLGRPKDQPDADITPLEACTLALQFAPDAHVPEGLAGALSFG